MIECIPNISEGRDLETINAVADAIESVDGVFLLDRHSDVDHHRTVFTFVGDTDPVLEAAFQVAWIAAERIDLTAHRGEHPRIGACDIIPIVPLAGESMETCIHAARRLGARIGSDLDVPVFLYEGAADTRRDLADVRRGGFEKLAGGAFNMVPDYGPDTVHPTAGATAIGARGFLIAWNVFLASPDVAIARAIARTLRESNGGLPGVKAIGLHLDQYGLAQVSMNLVDYPTTGMTAVFDAIESLAATHGTTIDHSELVGLVPRDALPEEPQTRLKLREFSSSQILENRISAKQISS
jgi:glutamate formiminotransferase